MTGTEKWASIPMKGATPTIAEPAGSASPGAPNFLEKVLTNNRRCAILYSESEGKT